MADRPIIFSAPMVRALLDGRKTQTRRILKPQPFPSGYHEGDVSFDGIVEDIIRGNSARFSATAVGGGAVLLDPQPLRYAVGDRLWVREIWRRCAWCPAEYDAIGGDGMAVTLEYKADGAKTTIRDIDFDIERAHLSPIPSIHMPRWASRLTLVVEAVKVERLQDISEEDAQAEGIYQDPARVYKDATWTYGGDTYFDRPSVAFWHLWTSLHGADSWAANPWVVALTFRVIRANIDALEMAHAAE